MLGRLPYHDFVSSIRNQLIGLGADHTRRDDQAGVGVSEAHYLTLARDLECVGEGVDELRHAHILRDQHLDGIMAPL